MEFFEEDGRIEMLGGGVEGAIAILSLFAARPGCGAAEFVVKRKIFAGGEDGGDGPFGGGDGVDAAGVA